MTKLSGSQLSLIAEIDCDDQPIGDWDYDELGTNKFLVPNSSAQKLGTKISLVPNSRSEELDTDKFLVPNSLSEELGTKEWTPPDYWDWKPPIGCFQQKWIKDHQYWYWRYYDDRGKKRSRYLHKDYNKAVRKAMQIGVPLDAKHLSIPTRQTNPQTTAPTQIHPLHLTCPADHSPGDSIAA